VTGLEGIGDAVTGGLAARAVEPHSGEADGHTHEGACLNCGKPLDDNYCGRCGQKGHQHRTLGAFWHDLLHGVLHVEGKTWRTLPMLALRPGELTRRYVEGERAKFVSPMALFLFSVFLMFAVFSAVGGPFDSGGADEYRNTEAEVGSLLKSEHSSVRQLQEARAELLADGDVEDARELEAPIQQAQRRIVALEQVKAVGGGNRSELIGGANTGWERFDKGVKKLNENPALAFYKLQNNAYKFSWLLIPLSVPFMWLLFPFRRETNLYFHTVFVTYSIAFMTLLAVVAALLEAAGLPKGAVTTLLIVVPPIHIFRQLKRAYRLRWWSALLRTTLLLLFTFVVLLMFLLALLVLGALG
jgi:hypothetical protein